MIRAYAHDPEEWGIVIDLETVNVDPRVESYPDDVVDFDARLSYNDPVELPRESLNRWLMSGSDESLVAEIIDDMPVRLHNWYPSDDKKMVENVRAWRDAMQRWCRAHVHEKEDGGNTWT